MRLITRPYLRYKFFNSLFTGAVGGSVFSIYADLPPSTFSIGGIFLAVGLMAMAYWYHRLMSLKKFFLFSLYAELIMLGMVVTFLLLPRYTHISLIVYGAYQLSYMLGGYLARAETHFAKKSKIMGWMDVAKQQGYLAGLTLSYLLYTSLEWYGINEAMEQIFILNTTLVPLELVIIFHLFRGFHHDL